MSAGVNNTKKIPELLDVSILGQLSQASSGSTPNASYVKSKIEEFSSCFNSSYRVAILECDEEEKQQLKYLLIYLKKSINIAISELGKSLKNRVYTFSCSVCNEQIRVNPAQDIWTSLQNHEHFEELYCQLLNNTLDIRSVAEKLEPFPSESESIEVNQGGANTKDSNADSGIDQHVMEPHRDVGTSGIKNKGANTSNLNTDTGIDQHEAQAHKDTEIDVSDEGANTGDSNADSGIDQYDLEAQHHAQVDLMPETKVKQTTEDVNNFRFNFQLTYDENVENALYPSSTANCIRKYDKVKLFSLMRISNSRAVCLVCNCEMNAKRISRHDMMDHAMGHKHLKASTFPPVLQLVDSYHNFWLNKDSFIQAHQVHFRPNSLTHMACALCNCLLALEDIVPHIKRNPHKESVMYIYDRGITSYFLINLQVQAYGVTQEEIAAKATAENLQAEAAKTPKANRAKKMDTDEPKNEGKSNQRVEEIQHDIIKSVDNPDTSNHIRLLPNRMRDYMAQLQAIPNRGVFCELCHVYMPNKVEILKLHYLTNPAHMVMRQLKYNYYCDICDLRFKNETAWLNNHNFFGPRHEKMAPSRRNKVTEYECTTCKMVIFGDNLSIARHKDAFGGKKKGKAGMGLPTQITAFLKSKVHILDQALKLAGDAEEVLRNSLTRDCCNRLESVLSEISQKCKVYPFGSRVSGLGNTYSDLDVFVDIGDTYYGQNNQDAKEQVILIRSINKILHKYKEFAGMVPVLTARTPILKLHHVPTKLDCDLSFKHGLSVENTKFLRMCIEMQPLCQKLILLLKKWTEYICFESITTYALAILCIFFLQTDGYLLSVEKLREINQHQPRVISGWKTITYVLPLNDLQMHIKVYEKTITELMTEFFSYYSRFDFNKDVVCPLLGEVVKRSDFEAGVGHLPPQMDTYVTQLLGDDPEVFRSNSFMCIQDPFDLSHNLTKAVQQGTLAKFQRMCQLTFEHLQKL